MADHKSTEKTCQCGKKGKDFLRCSDRSNGLEFYQLCPECFEKCVKLAKKIQEITKLKFDHSIHLADFLRKRE